MAIVARLRVPGATAHDHDRLQQEVEKRFATSGGPPEGLMVHLGYLDGDDLVLVEAWRTDELFEAYLREVLQPALDRADLRALGPEIRTALSIARP